MKIGFFITARLKSSRLRQKVLLDLNGKTVIEWVIKRCKATIGVDGVVLCTSTNPQDSVLYRYAQKEEIQFYAGSEDDVLQRLLDAAKYYHYDAFVSITADNPLFSIYTSQLLVDRYKTEPFDFGFTKGLPIGVATSLIETKALDIAVHMKKQTDTEIWGPFVNRPDYFNIFSLIVESSPFDESKRLTLDYPEDYELIRQIYKRNNKAGMLYIQTVFEILKNNPTLFKINAERRQKWPTEEQIAAIRECFNDNIEKGKEHAHKLSKQLVSCSSEEIIII
ncbi:MAG: NTP transferase domain-containing protein [Saprospiraceae bacterium]|nr:NTP transferase domain-containing protein [Saprospiraceae bacterium]